jgi:hypothetical protein
MVIRYTLHRHLVNFLNNGEHRAQPFVMPHLYTFRVGHVSYASLLLKRTEYILANPLILSWMVSSAFDIKFVEVKLICCHSRPGGLCQEDGQGS